MLVIYTRVYSLVHALYTFRYLCIYAVKHAEFWHSDRHLSHDKHSAMFYTFP